MITIKVIIGASAGGPAALKTLFSFEEKLKYPIILAMHNLDNQTSNFKDYLENISKQKVNIVKGFTELKSGIYIPEGGKDIIFSSKRVVSVIKNTGPVSPSINKLFDSLYPYIDKNTYIFLLGGLGNDGVKGLKKIENSKAKIYIQNDAQFPYMTERAIQSLTKYFERSIKELNRILIDLNRGDFI
ncbi:hypothetical protein X275_03145 [Marinitoga sp. 1197]|uniref:chemotaxis protein CheB n=1 Tax=unclassified Marinitoga TaxID=2640159 RepID=UPI0006413FAC|nr:MULTISPECIES: chemotaxis protein CheB [unclassified Marinitoga]KLO22377.1 hypothetical protein X274_08635 [Marinitoga sp. 1155]KLO23351.1 hypothetical protein X275_03145 [Marinitoga sp. 1197]NUU99503.1 hypothetical protein [Marinitoga sp. 1154]